MTTIEQLIEDIYELRELMKRQEAGLLVPYLRANQGVIMGFLRLAYKEHTREERLALQLKNSRLDSSGISDGFFETATSAIDDFDALEIGLVEITDDDLHMLIRGLRFAQYFGTDSISGSLSMSPVKQAR